MPSEIIQISTNLGENGRTRFLSGNGFFDTPMMELPQAMVEALKPLR